MRLLKFLAILLLIPQVCFGAGNSSMSFDGTNDKVSPTGYKGVTGTGARTIMGWFKNSLSASSGQLVAWGDSSGLNAGRSDTFAIESGVAWGRHNQSRIWSTGSGFGDSAWHSFAYTLGASQTNGDRKVNLDFTLRSPSFTNPTTAIDTLSDADFRAGESLTGTVDYSGLMAYIQLTATQLTQTEAYESLWKPGSVGNYQLFYPGWTTDSGTEKDLSGNGRDGTVTGAVGSSDGPPVMFGGGLPL